MLSIIPFLQSYIATRRQDDKGAAMVEYGILVAGIAVLVMATVFVLGGAIQGFFQDVVDQLGA